MPIDWKASLTHVNFRCGVCKHAFECAPDLIEDNPDQSWHPYSYFGDCPKCHAEAQPQAGWERALLKAHQHSTGPKTPEGIEIVKANIAGHPTPEEALRTRFNAMKHGLTARTATYFPAKPDRYSFCSGCDVDRGWCGQQAACVKQTEIFMLHHAAFEQRNPKVLGQLHGDLVSALTSALQMCLQEVLGDGVVLKVPKVELSRDGVPVTLSYEDQDGKKHFIYEYSSHPAFKPIEALVSRLGLSMTDLGMTVRAADGEEEEGMGRLQLDKDSLESLNSFGQRMLKATENAAQLISQAQAFSRNDPVLVEHQAQAGSEP